MKIIKILVALAIAFASCVLAFSITNSLIHFVNGYDELFTNLFIRVPVYIVSFLGIMGLIGFGAWNIFLYALSFSNVQNENNNSLSNTKPLLKKPSVKSLFGKTLIGTLATIIVGIIILFIWLLSLVQKHNDSKYLKVTRTEKNYEKVLSNINYSSEEFNEKAADVAKRDNRFTYYHKELNGASTDFINANKPVDIFEADVKRELALACMRNVLIDKVTKRTSFDTIKGYKLNTLKTIGNKRKAIQNLTIVDKNHSVYSYPLSSSYGVFKLDLDYGNRCNEMMSVDDMYLKFLPIYVKAKKEQLKNSHSNNAKFHAWVDKLDEMVSH